MDGVGGIVGMAEYVLAEVRSRLGGGAEEPAKARGRWRSVTVLASPDEIAPGGVYPKPLTELGDLVELRMQAAPGDKGTELSARLRRAEPSGLSGTAARVSGDDPRQAVRSALRSAKQLVEVGEVLVLEPVPHGDRGALGVPLAAVADKAGAEGVL